jgi:DNA-binding transcriptional MerR regulator
MVDDVTSGECTIDELARVTGVTVRTIRDHQTRGLLAPPTIRGRVGWYGPEHLARLRLIREMQADGFNLTAIRAVLERSPEGSEAILDFRHTLRAPFDVEQAVVMTKDEIVEAFGERDERAFTRAAKLGLLVPVGNGTYEVPSPGLFRAGAAAVAVGIPLSATLDLVERLRQQTDAAAEAFVKMFVRHLWRPHEAAGQPGESWPALVAALHELRPLASEALLGLFVQSMNSAVEAADRRETDRERRHAMRKAEHSGRQQAAGRKAGRSARGRRSSSS